MGGKRKPKPIITAKCYLCEFFHHSPPLRNDLVQNPRQCFRTGKEIHSFDLICEEFQLSQFFHCDRTNHRIPPALCHRRWKDKEATCNSKCIQRKELLVVSQPEGSGLKIRAGAANREQEIIPPATITLKKRCHLTL